MLLSAASSVEEVVKALALEDLAERLTGSISASGLFSGLVLVASLLPVVPGVPWSPLVFFPWFS